MMETTPVKGGDVTGKGGPTEELTRRISAEKGEPAWMLKKRLEGLCAWDAAPLPAWGPDLSALSFRGMEYYVSPDVAETDTWEDLPVEIASTFDALGIPEAERSYLGGVGAQYDSGVVYHRIQKKLEEQGVIFLGMDDAVRLHPELVERHYMSSCVPVDDHPFVSLHAACTSGGTFIYVPKGVKVTMPLQAYFRMNRARSAQFEHTLIIADEGSSVTYIEGCSAPQYTAASLHAGCVEIFVGKGASVRYISVENWSKNTYNLNTKRALVDENGSMTWIGGNMGSGTTMLYPTSILMGEGATSDVLGVVVAGKGQVQDTGAKVIHIAPHTSSNIRSKSLSKEGGVSLYRGLVRFLPSAIGATSSVVCDALLLDETGVSETIPVVRGVGETMTCAHEARVGRIAADDLFFLQSRGLSEDEATRVVVGGFLEPIARVLPLEYAIEFNRLIELEMTDSVG